MNPNPFISADQEPAPAQSDYPADNGASADMPEAQFQPATEPAAQSQPATTPATQSQSAAQPTTQFQPAAAPISDDEQSQLTKISRLFSTLSRRGWSDKKTCGRL